MQFTDEDIRKYQDLCRRYFDEVVDEVAAAQELTGLISLVSLLYRPLDQNGEKMVRSAIKNNIIDREGLADSKT